MSPGGAGGVDFEPSRASKRNGFNKELQQNRSTNGVNWIFKYGKFLLLSTDSRRFPESHQNSEDNPPYTCGDITDASAYQSSDLGYDNLPELSLTPPQFSQAFGRSCEKNKAAGLIPEIFRMFIPQMRR
uniref:Uncharacterized protein n=1 Tax=Coccidioides posadasii RMSCC 3488 TaxID=454284 RepID=A0A0J6IF48_COCPO|nr:hypothetical protein CPAG_06740 [Coccidioides posadasii RMSCC 3488]